MLVVAHNQYNSGTGSLENYEVVSSHNCGLFLRTLRFSVPGSAAKRLNRTQGGFYRLWPYPLTCFQKKKKLMKRLMHSKKADRHPDKQCAELWKTHEVASSLLTVWFSQTPTFCELQKVKKVSYYNTKNLKILHGWSRDVMRINSVSCCDISMMLRRDWLESPVMLRHIVSHVNHDRSHIEQLALNTLSWRHCTNCLVMPACPFFAR